mmetsp:Transcript_32803/g.59999  ORF Transcript_32803/g.59999 Transcript_32803/m.59999 type:complete len:211 (+) Transcript_32803:262-894(+)
MVLIVIHSARLRGPMPCVTKFNSRTVHQIWVVFEIRESRDQQVYVGVAHHRCGPERIDHFVRISLVSVDAQDDVARHNAFVRILWTVILRHQGDVVDSLDYQLILPMHDIHANRQMPIDSLDDEVQDCARTMSAKLLEQLLQVDTLLTLPIPRHRGWNATAPLLLVRWSRRWFSMQPLPSDSCDQLGSSSSASRSTASYILISCLPSASS